VGYFSREGHTLVWQEDQQKVWLQPWGKNGLRLRANVAGKPLNLPQALLEGERVLSDAEVSIEIGEEEAVIRSGLIRATLSRNGRIRYFDARSGSVLLEEPELQYFGPPPRHFRPRDGSLYQIDAWFKPQEGERFFGLGQHQHARLDQKGCVITLQQRNTEIAIPRRCARSLWIFPATRCASPSRISLCLGRRYWSRRYLLRVRASGRFIYRRALTGWMLTRERLTRAANGLSRRRRCIRSRSF
jgi:hypothetical protein